VDGLGGRDVGVVGRLGRDISARWSLTICDEAREAGGSFVSARRPPSWTGVRGFAADPERAGHEAARRARRQVRLYCAANRLNKLGTLTYRGLGNFEPPLLRAHVGQFWRDLRSELGGDPLAYVWVPEWHPEGHGLHVHFAVAKWIDQRVIERVWGRGFIGIKRIGGMPIGSDSLAESRKAAGYLAKYVAKTFGEKRELAGLHRYEVGQGFQPIRRRIEGVSFEEVCGHANERMGGVPSRSWLSRDQEEWDRPPSMWFQWP
jgi:hypothetical protein